MRTVTPKDKPLRAKAFAERFREACDESPHCPPKHAGRYIWITQRFAELRGEQVSTETCRKWHEGEAQARRDKIHTLAQILDTDPVWLETGHRQSKPRVAENEPLTQSPSSVTLTVRPGITIVINNLPDDLTASEAQRIANIVQAYVVQP